MQVSKFNKNISAVVMVPNYFYNNIFMQRFLFCSRSSEQNNLGTIFINMSKYRAFKFTIKKYETEELKQICSSKYDYLLICKKINNTLQGLIRFSSQKTVKTANTILLKIAEIEASTKIDNKYKDEFLSDSTIIFEAGVPAKNKKGLLKIIEEKDKIINNFVESQNTLFVQHKEQMEELMQTVKTLRDNDTEQLKQITNICLAIAKNSPSITNNTNNNTINNKFNLNIFLNEQCKNAVNLIDFVKGIQIELQDLLLYNKLGHAEAVSKIFDNAYQKMDLTMRPVHCTDIKRETVYVRNKNEWLNDESKEISERAMDIISNKSIVQMHQWKDANPDYNTSHDKNIEYLKLVKNISGGSSDAEERENKKKIIKNLSKNTHINKDQIAMLSP
jgi:hypothetical protein